MTSSLQPVPQQFLLAAPTPYHFAASVTDHGWHMLAPFQWDEERAVLRRTLRLNGDISAVTLEAEDGGVRVTVNRPLDAAALNALRDHLRWMLRLDEDLSPFYAVAREEPALWRVVGSGRGRLLRGPTLFEDVVKVICTTNTTWRQTVGMVERLVRRLGEPAGSPDIPPAFPTAQQITAADPALFDDEIRLGYRNAYVRRLAQEVAAGDRNLEALRTADLPTVELKKELKTIKGVGDYAAHSLLMLLGHYDDLAYDSIMRSHVTRTYFNGETPSPAEIMAVYDRWGRWKQLAYWFEMLAS
jgi:3-methyladenine DNA glycosylase/8-oxoguanine DNA glycosylase